LRRQGAGRHYANFNVKELSAYLDGEIIDFNAIDFKLQKIYALIKSHWEIKILENNLSEDLYMVVSHENTALIMHKEATKSKEVAALVAHWGIKQSEILAFGDDVNDADLLKYCGVSVAMDNAVEEIKTIADYICDTNENDGVARWINDYMRGL